MKKVIFAVIMLVVLCLAGCEEGMLGATSSENSDDRIDYVDAESIENAVLSVEDVKGKVVQFYVNDYAYDDDWGFFCQAGECLKFLFESEPDVEKGDTIVVRITDEPRPLFPTKFWRVPCELLKVSQKNENNGKEDTTSNTAADETKSVFYSTNDKETVKNGNAGIYSYKSKGGSYDVYWIIDFGAGYTYFFTEGNGESTCDKIAIVDGDLNDRITITWHDGGDERSWYLHFKYKNFPETLVVNDHFGFSTEFGTTGLENALKLRNTKTIKEY